MSPIGGFNVPIETIKLIDVIGFGLQLLVLADNRLTGGCPSRSKKKMNWVELHRHFLLQME